MREALISCWLIHAFKMVVVVSLPIEFILVVPVHVDLAVVIPWGAVTGSGLFFGVI